MVFSTLDAVRDTYRLGHRFRMPTASGSKDAVAVSGKVGDQLLSAYSFLLEHIVLLVWWISLIIALYISAQIYNHSHPHSELHSTIWRKRSTPFRIVKLTYQRFLHPGSSPEPKSKSDPEKNPKNNTAEDPESNHKPSRWFILLWLLIAISFVVVDYAVPIYFARFIKIGTAAPVSLDAIYVPDVSVTIATPPTLDSNLANIQFNELFIPSAIRATGNVDAVNETFKGDPPVKISQPEVLGVDANGEISLRFNYAYNITGLDFGLQNYSDLILNVEGSCMTEYSWWVGSTTNDLDLPGAFVDVYEIFNVQHPVSKYDGGPPTAQFFYLLPDDPNGTNFTWAALISSVNRSSYTVGTDPWYRTGPSPIAAANDNNPDYAPNMVLSQRPVLSCWENDVWSYRGHNAAVTNMGDIPGLDISAGIQYIFQSFIGSPMIVSLGSHLRQSALKSSSSSIADIIDASASSMHADLQRLIFASYIASVNVLTESTLFPSNSSTIIPNLLTPNGIYYPGTSDFVVISNDVVTLSIKALIIIPVITVALWVLLTVITLLPFIVSTIKSFSKEKDGEVEKKDEEEDGKKGKEEDGIEKSTKVLTDAKENFKEGATEQVSDAKEEAEDDAEEEVENTFLGGSN